MICSFSKNSKPFINPSVVDEFEISKLYKSPFPSGMNDIFVWLSLKYICRYEGGSNIGS